MHPMLNVATQAARKAGSLVIKYYEIVDSVIASKKSMADFIRKLSCAANHSMIDVIHKYYPQHVITNKEKSIVVGKDATVQWIIDPLDGKTNFTKRLPHFAISIVVYIKGRTAVSTIYDPIRNELFTATRGYHSQLNGYRLRSSSVRTLDHAVLAPGFLFQQEQNLNGYATLANELFIQCADFRRTGSTILDLAYVAAGRMDGFFKFGLNYLDFAGAELLVREAGGLITELTGEDYDCLLPGNLIAGNPCIIKAILSVLKNKFRKKSRNSHHLLFDN
ncbi:inositol-1-monophosphatase [Sodalis sp. CWE]|uniref:inositol-1-monophosphatase n=1 Tax=Sodalis sp. CWE TaxID=2803816 RepID=UPI001C7DF07A|nr:inositol-1-monophosphatase [Sodalis sp. CWE]MBX4181018.1 inositol-1-monophosphatase [Sodalis sp. CWE]